MDSSTNSPVFSYVLRSNSWRGFMLPLVRPPLCQCCQDQRGVAHAISEDALAAMASWEAWIGHGLGETKLQNTKTTTQFFPSQSVPDMYKFIYIYIYNMILCPSPCSVISFKRLVTRQSRIDSCVDYWHASAPWLWWLMINDDYVSAHMKTIICVHTHALSCKYTHHFTLCNIICFTHSDQHCL